MAFLFPKEPLTYVSEYSEGKDGILYKKVKEEDEHVFRILTTEDLSKEVRDTEGFPSSATL